jgi:hypothetical protein
MPHNVYAMEKTKKSKKALQGLINDSVKDAIGHLELPEASKKVKKLISRHSKKLAAVYADILKREEKKKKKAEKFMSDAVEGKTKVKKTKKPKDKAAA